MAKQKFGFDVVLANFRQNEMKLIRVLAVANKNYFVESFKRQAWGNKPWQEVKRRIKGTYEYKYPKRKDLSRRRKPILVKNGILRRKVSTSIKQVTTKEIKFGVDLPYAAIHNEGLRMVNGRKMPKRQFMGWNKEIGALNKRTIDQFVLNSFK
ncbi:phage virion morphogenesis protein [Chitinophaga sp. Hz27]|uniref:phage virion morphogenesis protein n=1 Tax=Chitinophaga sp. Hz27 TaxID=3347169 RepID=UPI0035DB6B4D